MLEGFIYFTRFLKSKSQRSICMSTMRVKIQSFAIAENSLVYPSFFSKNIFPDEESILFKLNINGKTVQEGNSGLMIFGFDEIISHVSRYVTLKIGDLIYTGTPANVGPVKIGDHLEGYLENKKLLDFWVK